MSGRSRGGLRAARNLAALLCSGFTLSVSAGAARAQPATTVESTSAAPALAWSGPGPELTCLGEAGLARAVNDYLGREAFASSAVELVLHVDVERLGDRTWHAALSLVDRSGRVLGRRDLTSGNDLCSSLDEPLVLAVALMVDAEPELPPPPVAAREPEPEPEPPPEPPPETEPPSRPGLTLPRLRADVTLALEAGLLPEVRPGIVAGVELVAAPWLFTRLRAMGFVPTAAEVGPDASVRFALLGGQLELCPSAGALDGIRGALCLGFLYGALHAESSGLASGRSTWEALLGASVGAHAHVPLAGRWALVADAAGVLPYRPERFVYVEAGVSREIFRVSSPSLLATLGASVTF